jgi:hypothetical protein
MDRKRVIVTFLGLFLVMSFGVSAGWAQETGGLQADRWSFTLAPYVWGTGLKGNIRALPPLPSSNVNASFGDIVENLDLGFMTKAELRKGRWGILTDIMWTKVSADGSTPGPLFSSTRLDSETLMATVAVAFRMAENERAWLDLVAGVRGYYVNTDLNLRAGLLPERTLSDSTGWVDGLAGLRGRVNIWKGLYLSATTLAGGGGSNIAVDLTGGMGYAFNQHISTFAGYRYVKVDYKKSSGFVWDVEYKGPFLGMAFTF